MEFTGKLGKYKIIETEDQTKTVWSEYFDEACHNLSGAWNETLYNYIQGCHVPEQLKGQKNVHVFDVGFGIGVGLLAFIDELKKHPVLPNRHHTYTSMELDEDLFLWSIDNSFKDFSFTKRENYYECELLPCQLTIKVFIGDGRVTIPNAFKQKLVPAFTAIFQDAFSPKKNPTLWTTEWFGGLKDMSAQEVFMSTYSASVSIRKSMIAAGWKIENQKGFGQKKSMTKARLIGITQETLAAELSKSPTLELHDI